MPNSLKYITDWISLEPLRLLKNKLQAGQFANTDYNKEYTGKHAVGSVVQVKLPQRWIPTNGLGWQPQAIDRKTTNITLDQVFGIHFQYDGIEKVLNFERSREEFKNQYMEPAMSTLAQEIDTRFCAYAAKHTANIVGVLGTNPANLDAVSGAARQRMVEMACPPSNDKGMIVSPAIERMGAAAGLAVFNPASDISRQYREGSMGRQGGFDWYSSMSLLRHTCGVWAVPANVVLSAAAATGATSLTITAGAGDTFLEGDVIGIAGCFATNPGTRQITTTATTYTAVVAQDLTAAGGGADILYLRRPIYGPGSPYQNVNALPALGALLTMFPGSAYAGAALTGVNGLALHRDAFMMVGVPMELPKAVEMSSTSRDPETGLAINFVQYWDGDTYTMKHRWDCLIGFGEGYPDNCAVRILGA